MLATSSVPFSMSDQKSSASPVRALIEGPRRAHWTAQAACQSLCDNVLHAATCL